MHVTENDRAKALSNAIQKKGNATAEQVAILRALVKTGDGSARLASLVDELEKLLKSCAKPFGPVGDERRGVKEQAKLILFRLKEEGGGMPDRRTRISVTGKNQLPSVLVGEMAKTYRAGKQQGRRGGARQATMWEPQQRKIFVSHCAKRTSVAQEFQRLIRKHPLRNKGIAPIPRVFVSSDPDSITTGEPWLEAVLRNLDNCTDFVALIADHEDWKSLWIPFEAAYFMGRQRGLAQHDEVLRQSEKRPQIFVFGQLIESASFPLSGLHLIDTRDSYRVQDAMLGMDVGPWTDDGECKRDFTTFFQK